VSPDQPTSLITASGNSSKVSPPLQTAAFTLLLYKELTWLTVVVREAAICGGNKGPTAHPANSVFHFYLGDNLMFSIRHLLAALSMHAYIAQLWAVFDIIQMSILCLSSCVHPT
jgi:hypothetical protein